MRPHGTAAELDRRRFLAVERLGEGYTAQEVADLLGVRLRTVRGWKAAHRKARTGLLAQAAARTAPQTLGRPGTRRPDLGPQESAVVRFRHRPLDRQAGRRSIPGAPRMWAAGMCPAEGPADRPPQLPGRRQAPVDQALEPTQLGRRPLFSPTRFRLSEMAASRSCSRRPDASSGGRPSSVKALRTAPQ